MSGCGPTIRSVNSGPAANTQSAAVLGGVCAPLAYRTQTLHAWAAMPASAAPSPGCTWQQSDGQRYRVRLNALTQDPRPVGNQAVAVVADVRGKVRVFFGPAATFEVARATSIDFDTRGKPDRFRQYTKFPQEGNKDLVLEVQCVEEPCFLAQAGFDGAVP
jgi:hypothetical protein